MQPQRGCVRLRNPFGVDQNQAHYPGLMQYGIASWIRHGYGSCTSALFRKITNGK